MPDESVHCCITSPPYFGLRDYGTGRWEGGEPTCDHGGKPRHRNDTTNESTGRFAVGSRGLQSSKQYLEPWHEQCGKCGARRVDDQLGLEATPDEYVAQLVDVFREVRRVLRDDGTLWLNLGDSYHGGGYSNHAINGEGWLEAHGGDRRRSRQRDRIRANPDLKPKDLVGIPWMVAFALRQDGWYLRADVVWSKPNPMPESVTDRPTKAHEYVFLLAKSTRYYFDSVAIAEDGTDRSPGNVTHTGTAAYEDGDEYHRRKGDLLAIDARGTRNKRSVWTVPTQPFPGAHFAVFPPKLIEPCVLAGSPPKACVRCRAPWVRGVEREVRAAPYQAAGGQRQRERTSGAMHGGVDNVTLKADVSRSTLAWEPSCDHRDDSDRCVVLDPFSGAGTTGLVATRLGRSYIGIELNPKYVDLSRDRLSIAQRLGYRSPERVQRAAPGQLSLLEHLDARTT